MKIKEINYQNKMKQLLNDECTKDSHTVPLSPGDDQINTVLLN